MTDPEYQKTVSKSAIVSWIIIALLIIAITFYLIFQEVKINSYQKGVNDGIIQTASIITTTYQVPIIQNNNITWVGLGKICGGEE